MNEILAFFAATTFILGCADLTLNEQKMATTIGAVNMGIGGSPALVAMGNDILGDTFTEPVVK